MPVPTSNSESNQRQVRLAYFVSHPIQYQAPLLRRIAQEPDIDLTVFFGSDFSVRGYADKGFGVGVKWDVPLVEGYKHKFLPILRDNKTVGPMAPINRGFLRVLQGFDVLWVHGYASVNGIHAILAANALGIPVLLRAESHLADRDRSSLKLLAKRGFFGILRQMVDGVLPIGTRNAQYWNYYFGEACRAWPMPYAVDNAYFETRSREARESRRSLQEELGLDPGRPMILFASKLQKRKCCIDLVKAFLAITAEGAIQPYLVIVGDGEERSSLEQVVAQSGSNDVRFCGFRNQSELPRFFDLATVFVLPSRHEPWGLIVNEVMNASRPVILSDDVGCHPDLVTNGVEGFVYPVGDVEALAAALRKVLGTPGLAEQMGSLALKRIRQWNFEADICGLRSALGSLTHKIAFSQDGSL